MVYALAEDCVPILQNRMPLCIKGLEDLNEGVLKNIWQAFKKQPLHGPIEVRHVSYVYRHVLRDMLSFVRHPSEAFPPSVYSLARQIIQDVRGKLRTHKNRSKQGRGKRKLTPHLHDEL